MNVAIFKIAWGWSRGRN